MLHTPIILSHITLAVPGKNLISDFTATIPYGNRVGIIGRNGGGKSMLLKSIAGESAPAAGTITLPKDAVISMVPQLIAGHDSLSGSQRFNAALSTALATRPDILLLDEPTNHLDSHNRRSLSRMLQAFRGTLIVVSHDPELLRTCIGTLWHVEDGAVRISSKPYDEYKEEQDSRREQLQQALNQLNREKKEVHLKLMHEQTRRKKQAAHGEKRYGAAPTIVRGRKKELAQITNNKKGKAIAAQKQSVLEQLKEMRAPEIIAPTFTLTSAHHSRTSLITISDGSIGYSPEEPTLTSINLHITSGERVVLTGRNGSGKSTLIKGILGAPSIHVTGRWLVPNQDAIGYLDQHYGTLNREISVLENIQKAAPPGTPHADLRLHLNRYLFRKNEEIAALVSTLSGGERARLSLALIGIHTPQLLILDEVTNNLDLETRQHVIEVLRAYPGALLVISHDEDFLEEIGISSFYEISEGTLAYSSSRSARYS